MNYLLVFIGGGLGSVSRFGISQLLPKFYLGSFPLATLLANLFACIILAIVMIGFRDKTISLNWSLFLATGFCGGFSTFSTFSAETVELIQNQNYFYAILNISISIIACFLILFYLLKFK